MVSKFHHFSATPIAVNSASTNHFLSRLLLPLLLLLTALGPKIHAVPLVSEASTSTFQQFNTEDEETLISNALTHVGDPDSGEGREKWRSVLMSMTTTRPCGSMENFLLCANCSKATGNGEAFYLCCVNSLDVRKFCVAFINYTFQK